jgi:hypothetical protein
MACGAHGLGLLPLDSLAFIEPALAVALAALGAVTGMTVPRRHAPTVTLLVVAATAGLASASGRSPIEALSFAAQGCGLALVLAAVGSLLVTDDLSEAEHRLFMFAALLLLGGAADYTSVSPLASGLLAGMFWQRSGGYTSEHIRSDLRYVERPLIALLLLVAGNRAQPLIEAVPFAIAWLALTTGITMTTGWRPGVFFVAIALSGARIIGTDASLFLSAVVMATIASESRIPARLPSRASV